MCEIELGLTVTGSLIQLDIVCYLGARLSLTSDYECKVGLGLCCEIQIRCDLQLGLSYLNTQLGVCLRDEVTMMRQTENLVMT